MKWIILGIIILSACILCLAIFKVGSLADDYIEEYFKEAQNDRLKK
jgi:hypothetical protein